MSIFAIATAAFICGWSLAAWLLLAAPPVLLTYFFDVRRQSGPAARANTNTNYLDILRTARRIKRRRLRKRYSLTGRNRFRLVRLTINVAFFLLALVAVLIFVGEISGVMIAFRTEEFVVGNRLFVVALFAIIGALARTYQRELIEAFSAVFQIALVSKKSSEDSGTSQSLTDLSVPWYVQIGIIVSIIIVAMLSFNPEIMKNVVSLKAGSLEAHFTQGQDTAQSNLLISQNPLRKINIKYWSRFKFPDGKDGRSLTYEFNNDIAEANIKDGLEGSRINKDRIKIAMLFFEEHIRPVFAYMIKTEKAKVFVPITQHHKIENISSKLASIIISSKTRNPSEPVERFNNQLRALIELKRNVDALDREGSRTLPADNQTVLLGLDEAAIKQINSIKNSEDCKNFISDRKTAFFERLCNYYKDDFWDPYIIQSVAAMLSSVFDRTKEEKFLAIATSDLANGGGVCEKRCESPVSGQLALMYAVAFSEVNSIRPWPSEDMRMRIETLLSSSKEVLLRNNRSKLPAQPREAARSLDVRFRRNRLVDLSLGLQLFNQRALLGYQFTPAQVQSWSSWATETIEIVKTIGLDDYFPDRKLTKEERNAWGAVRDTLIEEPHVFQDAAISAALSAALLSMHRQAIAASDCATSEWLYRLANNDSKLRIYFEKSELDEDDKATYRGFLEQAHLVIKNFCQRT